MGWVKRLSNSGQEQDANLTSLSLQASSPSPERALPSNPPVNSLFSQSPARDILTQPHTPESANSGRRKRGIWKGEVKSCTVIAGELRGQLLEEREEESATPTRPPAHAQTDQKRDGQMNWREELDGFRVP
ncbi:hypothetical protein PFICI_04272 [Pestalotiopsis fici W106-1]|uniref:Uncharacterized protein n=1 Tax=Pestalotiopsis fici (strain W106-1 / CGMCC3.15140) TaxID=1229662 RepID=W3XB33_PESFW|nr:uncharacterized protein PFICI_04272 [Pestalotiopsis fici W106-1]ETS82396.1 hypothetical protein PFICI_04272 [Pestalotiopsis fici W106-1]